MIISFNWINKTFFRLLCFSFIMNFLINNQKGLILLLPFWFLLFSLTLIIWLFRDLLLFLLIFILNYNLFCIFFNILFKCSSIFVQFLRDLVGWLLIGIIYFFFNSFIFRNFSIFSLFTGEILSINFWRLILLIIICMMINDVSVFITFLMTFFLSVFIKINMITIFIHLKSDRFLGIIFFILSCLILPHLFWLR